MTLHKEYHTLTNGQEIKCSISFNRESTNWATNQPIKIGYRVTVIPVKRTKHDGYIMEESMAFTGVNATLLEVNRQSKQRLEHAIELLKKKLPEFIEYFTRELAKETV